MARRRSVPPFLTLDGGACLAEPSDGWELIKDDRPAESVLDGAMFPAWDSALQFSLRRRFTIDTVSMQERLGLQGAQCKFRLVTRLETGRGLLSEVVDARGLGRGETPVEVTLTPDSSRLSRDMSLVSSIVLMHVEGDVDELAPSIKGARVWESRWTTRLEGGKTRLPMEVISFSTGLWRVAAPRALFHVAVADLPDLDFEQAVCVYLNSDCPAFVAGIEKGEPAATAILWEGVVRQLIAFGLSSAFVEDRDDWPEGSIGRQVRSWQIAIFPGEKPDSIMAFRAENPGVYEARIQSWANTGAFWT